MLISRVHLASSGLTTTIINHTIKSIFPTPGSLAEAKQSGTNSANIMGLNDSIFATYVTIFIETKHAADLKLQSLDTYTGGNLPHKRGPRAYFTYTNLD
jgi:hypothetical protein